MVSGIDKYIKVDIRDEHASSPSLDSGTHARARAWLLVYWSAADSADAVAVDDWMPCKD